MSGTCLWEQGTLRCLWDRSLVRPRMRASRSLHSRLESSTRNMLYFPVFIFIFFSIGLSASIIIAPEWKIYYDLRTNQTIDTIDTSNPRVQLHRQYAKKLRIGFGPIPCSCEGLTCGCCAGMNIQAFNFNRRACMNFTYDPQEFAINMNMLMDDQSLFSNTVSAKNPPPVCVPAPLPPIVPTVDFCLRFFNIHTPGYNIFMCMDFETRMERAPLLVLHFDCMELGQDGISYHKPDEVDYTGQEEQSEQPIDGQEDEQIEIYDEVVEDSSNSTSNDTEPVVTENRMSDGSDVIGMATTEVTTPKKEKL